MWGTELFQRGGFWVLLLGGFRDIRLDLSYVGITR